MDIILCILINIAYRLGSNFHDLRYFIKADGPNRFPLPNSKRSNSSIRRARDNHIFIVVDIHAMDHSQMAIQIMQILNTPHGANIPYLDQSIVGTSNENVLIVGNTAHGIAMFVVEVLPKTDAVVVGELVEFERVVPIAARYENFALVYQTKTVGQGFYLIVGHQQIYLFPSVCLNRFI